MTALMARFQDEITALLCRFDIPFSIEEGRYFHTVKAQRQASAGSYAGAVTIVLIPIGSTTLEEARRQSLAVFPLTGHPDTVILAEDRWRKSPETMSRRILAHLGIFRGIFARDCEVRKISRSEADSFLSGTHSYGGAKSRYCYGIFLKRDRVRCNGLPSTAAVLSSAPPSSATNISDDFTASPIVPGTMVAAAEFSNARRWLKSGQVIRSYEWIRYASLPDVRINGGMGKVLKHFISEIHPDDIMSYADLEWSDGQAYQRLGFIQDGHKSPVSFMIGPDTWTRIPLKSDGTTGCSSKPLYFMNFGSRKYRMSLWSVG